MEEIMKKTDLNEEEKMAEATKKLKELAKKQIEAK